MPLLPVTFADAQAVTVDYLRPLLAVGVHVRIPDPRPATFVSLRRVGGVRTALSDPARVDLFAWAGSDEAAHDLLQTLRTHLAVMPGERGGTHVLAVDEFAGPVPAPDASGQPRWMCTYEITLRGVSG